MTKKQIDLYNKVSLVLGDAETADVVTALTCIVSQTVCGDDVSRTHGASLQNLMFRHIQYFNGIKKFGGEPNFHDIPKFKSY